MRKLRERREKAATMRYDIAMLRDVVVRVTQMLTGNGIRVTQEGAQAFVQPDKNGKPIRVNIPYVPDNATEDLVLAIQGFIDHEVGHVLFTEFTYKQKERKADPRLHNLHNLIEDPLIEKLMGERFPGSHYNVEITQEFFLSKVTEPRLLEAENEAEEFAYILVPMMRALAGQKAFQTWMDKNGYWTHPRVEALMARMPADIRGQLGKMRNSRDSFKVAELVHEAMYGKPPEDESKEDGPEGQPSRSKSKPQPKDKSEDCDGEGSNTELPEDADDKGAGGESSDSDDTSSVTDDAGGAKPEKAGKSGKSKKDKKPKDEGEAEAEKPKLEKSEPEKGEGKEDESKPDDKDDEPEADAGDADEPAESEGEAAGEGEPEGDDPELDDEDAEDAGGDEDPAAADDGDEGDSAGDLEEPADEADGDDAAGDEDAESDPAGGEDDGAGEPSDPADDGDDEIGDGGEPGDDGEVAEDAKSETPGQGSSKPVPGDDVELKGDPYADSIGETFTVISTVAMRRADYRVFSKDYDKIEPYADGVPSDEREAKQDDRIFEKFDNATNHMIGPMQKDIERMMAAQSKVQKLGGFRSGRLHSAALHRLIVNDDRVFRRQFEAKSKNTVVGLLIDNSGSMHGEKMRIAMEAGYALSQTLERVGIPHEVLGFTTLSPQHDYLNRLEAEETRIGKAFHRVEPLYMPIYKGFDERLTPPVKRRFSRAAMTQGFLCNNVDGECVETAGFRLLKRKEERKVLIVLSDGSPAAASNMGYSKRENGLNEHLKGVVEDLAKLKVETIGIGIQDGSVKHFYPRHMVLRETEDLPGAVMGELKRILTV